MCMPCFAQHLCQRDAILLPLSHFSSNSLLHYFPILGHYVPCPRSSHIIIMTFECKDFLLLSLYRRPRSYKTVEQKTFSIFYYIIHWLCEWVYIFPFSKKYRWYFEFFFFFFQSVDDVKKHLKRWDLMHHGVKTQQSNAFGLLIIP